MTGEAHVSDGALLPAWDTATMFKLLSSQSADWSELLLQANAATQHEAQAMTTTRTSTYLDYLAATKTHVARRRCGSNVFAGELGKSPLDLIEIGLEPDDARCSREHETDRRIGPAPGIDRQQVFEKTLYFS